MSPLSISHGACSVDAWKAGLCVGLSATGVLVRGASRRTDAAREPPRKGLRRPREQVPRSPADPRAAIQRDAAPCTLRSTRDATTSSAPPAMNSSRIERIDRRESPVTAAVTPDQRAGRGSREALPIML